MTIKIDKGIPIPSKNAKPKYPLADLAVGDSFFAANIQSASIWGYISVHRKKNGGQFTTRTVTENGVKGVRVWRVE